MTLHPWVPLNRKRGVIQILHYITTYEISYYVLSFINVYGTIIIKPWTSTSNTGFTLDKKTVCLKIWFWSFNQELLLILKIVRCDCGSAVVFRIDGLLEQLQNLSLDLRSAVHHSKDWSQAVCAFARVSCFKVIVFALWPGLITYSWRHNFVLFLTMFVLWPRSNKIIYSDDDDDDLLNLKKIRNFCFMIKVEFEWN